MKKSRITELRNNSQYYEVARATKFGKFNPKNHRATVLARSPYEAVTRYCRRHRIPRDKFQKVSKATKANFGVLPLEAPFVNFITYYK